MNDDDNEGENESKARGGLVGGGSSISNQPLYGERERADGGPLLGLSFQIKPVPAHSYYTAIRPIGSPLIAVELLLYLVLHIPEAGARGFIMRL